MDLFEMAAKLCEWCRARPAVARVVGTDACADCRDAGRGRVVVALQRWKGERRW